MFNIIWTVIAITILAMILAAIVLDWKETPDRWKPTIAGIAIIMTVIISAIAIFPWLVY